jgi:hypothetical protein
MRSRSSRGSERSKEADAPSKDGSREAEVIHGFIGVEDGSSDMETAEDFLFPEDGHLSRKPEVGSVRGLGKAVQAAMVSL